MQVLCMHSDHVFSMSYIFRILSIEKKNTTCWHKKRYLDLDNIYNNKMNLKFDQFIDWDRQHKTK